MNALLGDVTVRNCKSILVIVVTIMLVASACSSNNDPGSNASSPDSTTGSDGSGDNTGNTDGNLAFISETTSGVPLSLQLTEGQPATQTDDAEPISTVDGEPLSDTAIAQVIDRLPEWTDNPDDTQDFNRPAETLRPPTSGTTIATDFPASGDDLPPAVDNGPLEVLRFQPEGPVQLAPFISLTFNQAMAPVGTVGQLDDVDVPVTITPAIDGHWEWIGTRTPPLRV